MPKHDWKHPYIKLIETADRCVTLTAWETDFLAAMRRQLDDAITEFDLPMPSIHRLEQLAMKAVSRRPA